MSTDRVKAFVAWRNEVSLAIFAAVCLAYCIDAFFFVDNPSAIKLAVAVAGVTCAPAAAINLIVGRAKS